jgi:DNA (cytosine-5)-methyltransferase 1
MPFTHIDCFSGPGGICTGFRAAGLDTRIAIELVQSCVDTYKANHPHVHVIHSDIRNIAPQQILHHIPADGVDLVSSGMPCETFSTAGNSSRSFYDDRCFLFREGIRIAQIANAKMILFENVPAIITKRISKTSQKLIVDVLKKELAEAGYGNMVEIVLNSTNYGVPQRRRRYFILACRYPDWALSSPESIRDDEMPVSEAFLGLPNVVPNSGKEGKNYTKKTSEYVDLLRNNDFWKLHDGGICDTITYQMPMKHRGYTLERFSLLRQGESLKDLFVRYTGEEREKLQSRRVMPKKMFIKRNYRLKLAEPSPTVTSHCLDEFVHPKYERALTVRECARLQSFPDSYDFAGGPYIIPHINKDIQDKYEQIGDAVPPLLAYAWGRKISEILEENLNVANGG